MPSPADPDFRRQLYERDRGICQLCGEPVPFEKMHLDHIHPRILGGDHTAGNLRVTHKRCNISRGIKGQWTPKDYKGTKSQPLPDIDPHLDLRDADGPLIKQSDLRRILVISYAALRGLIADRHLCTYKHFLYTTDKGVVWVSADDVMDWLSQPKFEEWARTYKEMHEGKAIYDNPFDAIRECQRWFLF